MADTSIDFGILTNAQSPLQSFKAGDVIFKEGDPAHEMFVVKHGQIEIRSGNRLLDTIRENNIFGEMALIDTAPRSATAIAATDVQLVPISEKQFIFMVRQTPFFALNVMRTLAQRLRHMNTTI